MKEWKSKLIYSENVMLLRNLKINQAAWKKLKNIRLRKGSQTQKNINYMRPYV